MSDSLQPLGLQPARLSRLWNPPGKNTGVGVCAVCARSLQSCPALRNPTDYNPPGSSVHGILQPRTLEWAAISSSRGSSHPRDQTGVSCISCIGRQVLYHQHHPGNPQMWHITMEYYSAIKSSKTGSFAELWIDLESVIPSEVSRKDRNKHHIVMQICEIYR